MILANGCNITKSETFKGVWILSVPTLYSRNIYMVYRSILQYFLEWEHNVYISSSKEVEVVNRGCWAEQPQSCPSFSFKERHFSYSPEFWSQSGASGPKADLRTVILTG